MLRQKETRPPVYTIAVARAAKTSNKIISRQRVKDESAQLINQRNEIKVDRRARGTYTQALDINSHTRESALLRRFAREELCAVQELTHIHVHDRNNSVLN